MVYNLQRSTEVLERTPQVLRAMLEGLPGEWIMNNEGGETWSPYDIVGHLIHGELTDWIPRMEVFLSESGDKTFVPFDRFAQFQRGKEIPISQLLQEFRELREKNLEILRSKNLSLEDLGKKANHPSLGEVTLSQLLAAWTVHDLNHIAQISRVMAKQYINEVGPWVEYLGVLNS